MWKFVNNNVKNRQVVTLSAMFLIIASLISCSVAKKTKSLHRGEVSVKIAPVEYKADTAGKSLRLKEKDTVRVITADKKEEAITVYRTNDGELYAEDQLDAVIVESTFKNVAERNGKVDLSFKVTVPKSMQDSRWQIRFYPQLEMLGEQEKLDPVFITGKAYRKAQLRGYQQYERFLSRIISDTTVFINLSLLEIFIQRNIPQIYYYKSDSSRVSDEVFYSHYGVSEQQAIAHYTNKLAKKRNDSRKSKKAKKFAKYVKLPIQKEGIRLDTVVVNDLGDFVYTYVQTISTKPGLKKAEISMIGEVYEEEKQVYRTPQIGPLDFYISSISSFADNLTIRYKTKVVERRAMDNKVYQINFKSGKSNLDLDLANNRQEVGRIQSHLVSLMENTVYDLDSIIVMASASPEGTRSVNQKLSHNRSISLTNHFEKYVAAYRDSLNKDVVEVNLDSLYGSNEVELLFTPRSVPEDWNGLWQLVVQDTVMLEKDKKAVFDLYDVKDEDKREAKLKKHKDYAYMRANLYPQLRSVMFKFYMHRKGMVKDTVHTTIVDTTYMDGVKALKDMDYKKALSLLVDYKDYNTAVAYVSMGMNASAVEILQKLEKTAQVNYLLAILSARNNDVQSAVNYYLESCRENPSYVHRGNLDPEIAELIKEYGLHAILEKEEEALYE